MTKILKFQATWCNPCKALSASLKGIDIGAPIEELDVDSDRDLAIQYGIRSVPTLVLIKNDAEVDRIVGNTTVAKIKEWVEKNA